MFEKASKEELDALQDRANARSTKPKWPYQAMEVGDIVRVEIGQYGKTHPQVYAHTYGTQTGKKFATDKLSDGAYRIIRIA